MQIPTAKIPADNARGYKIVNADDPRAAAPAMDLTREAVVAMDKADLVCILDAHGVEFDRRLGVERLREMAAAVVFVDL